MTKFRITKIKVIDNYTIFMSICATMPSKNRYNDHSRKEDEQSPERSLSTGITEASSGVEYKISNYRSMSLGTDGTTLPASILTYADDACIFYVEQFSRQSMQTEQIIATETFESDSVSTTSTISYEDDFEDVQDGPKSYLEDHPHLNGISPQRLACDNHIAEPSFLFEQDSSLKLNEIDKLSGDFSRKQRASSISIESIKQRKKKHSRRKYAKRISQGDLLYHEYLLFRENLVQQNARRSIEQKRRLHREELNHEIFVDNFHDGPISTTPQEKFMGLKSALKFEWYFSLYGSLAITVYSVAYTTTNSIIAHIVGRIFNGPTYLVQTISFLFGVSLLRLTGLLWSWSSKENYKATCFMMRNKSCFGHWDTRVMRWIRRRSTLKNFLEVVGGILVFQSVGYFSHDIGFSIVCGNSVNAAENIPSAAYGDLVQTHVANALHGKERTRRGGFRHLGRTPQIPAVSFFESIMHNLLDQEQCLIDPLFEIQLVAEELDEKYLERILDSGKLSELLGSNYPMVTLSNRLYFNAAAVAVSVSILHYTGGGFWNLS